MYLLLRSIIKKNFETNIKQLSNYIFIFCLDPTKTALISLVKTFNSEIELCSPNQNVMSN